MTNREMLIQSLQCEDVDEYTVDYISCLYVHNPDCTYDGCNSSCCTECKMKWLEEEWKD